MSAGNRWSSEIRGMAVGCSAGAAEVSRGTVPDHHHSGDLLMSRLGFGAFLAPHHPIGEHPMLQFRRDLDLVERLDSLGYDEFWCGEHHSSGWEMIGSPEMFLAAAGERTKRIKLATGSSPALPPSVQRGATDGAARLHDRRTGDLRLRAWSAGLGRPHARHRSDVAARPPGRGHRRHPPPDARRTPDRQVRLVHPAGRRPAAVAAAGGHAFAVASQISPSGMTLAGKHGIGIISIGSLSEEGLNALPTQWGFAEAA